MANGILGYMTADELGVQNDIAVLPCGGLSPGQPRNWTTETLAPYLEYRPSGKPIDRMFGGVMLKPVRSARGSFLDPLYAGFGPPADLKDWAQWINELFTPGMNLQAAAALTSFGQKDVWIALPYPHIAQLQFGKIGDRNLSFALTPDRVTALQWWTDRFVSAWASKSSWTQRLRLQGFVWPRASVYAVDEPVVRQINRHVHALRLKSLWLPNYGSYGVDKWRNLGFDAAIIDSNYTGYGAFDRSWLRNAGYFAKVVHTGIQVVAGRGTIYSPTHLDEYLDAGRAEGYMGAPLKAYIFPNRTLAQLRAANPAEYIRLYSFIKGI